MALADNNASIVAAWHCDEASGNLLDAVGSSNLTETSGTIDAATGILSGARDFERGDTEYAACSDNAALSMGDIDFCGLLWAKLESKTDNHVLLIKGPTNYAYALEYRSGDDRFEFAIASATGFANFLRFGSAVFSSVSTGAWYMLAFKHDSVGNVIGLSVNGANWQTTAYSSGCWDDGGEFRLGANDFGDYYDGLIDEVVIWKGYLLTNADLAEAYASGAGLAYPFGAGAAGHPAGEG